MLLIPNWKFSAEIQVAAVEKWWNIKQRTGRVLAVATAWRWLNVRFLVEIQQWISTLVLPNIYPKSSVFYFYSRNSVLKTSVCRLFPLKKRPITAINRQTSTLLLPKIACRILFKSEYCNSLVIGNVWESNEYKGDYCNSLVIGAKTFYLTGFRTCNIFFQVKDLNH